MKIKYLLLAITFLHTFFSFSIGNPVLPHNSILFQSIDLLLTPPMVYPDMDGDLYFSMIAVPSGTLDNNISRQGTPGNDCRDDDYDYHPGAVYYRDFDVDGYGDLPLIITACESITGYVLTNGDCNDQNALINPDSNWFIDNDGDGYGNVAVPFINNPSCQQPPGYILDNTDCNDNNSQAHAVENWYADTDGDGYGSGTPTSSCGSPVNGYVKNDYDTCPNDFGPYEGCIIPNPSVIYGVRNKNYIITTIPKVAVTDTQNINNSNDAVVNISYFDGLGRPIQQIACNQSGTGNNLITPIEYDNLGRQLRDYLMYSTTAKGLEYVSTALTDQTNFPQYSGQNPYSQKFYEP